MQGMQGGDRWMRASLSDRPCLRPSLSDPTHAVAAGEHGPTYLGTNVLELGHTVGESTNFSRADEREVQRAAKQHCWR
eukprot:354470-Chlamydomonas_euryale.AAC.50